MMESRMNILKITLKGRKTPTYPYSSLILPLEELMLLMLFVKPCKSLITSRTRKS